MKNDATRGPLPVLISRGEVACIAFNRQEADEWEVDLTFSLPEGAV